MFVRNVWKHKRRICNLILGLKGLRPKSDRSETSHCNVKGLSVSEVMRIENLIAQVELY